MIVLGCQQNSPEWLQARVGVVTASNFDCIITPTGKAATADRRARYMNRLLAEWKVGRPLTEWDYKNQYMEHGNENEDSAVALYEMTKGVDTKKVGFVFKDDKKLVGCSPDRMIGIDFQYYEHPEGDNIKAFIYGTDTGGLEIKNPAPWTHIGYLLKGTLPTDYIPQVQGSLWVTGVLQWDFMSNCSGFDPLIITVERDEKYIEKLEKAVNAFIDEMLEKREQLKRAA